MSIVISNSSHKLSIHVNNGRNPIIGRAEPLFNDDVEYFEGVLKESTRDVCTGELEEIDIYDIDIIKFKGD